MMPPSEVGPGSWYLVGFMDEGRRQPIRVPLRRFPFSIGRQPDADLCLPSAGVSGRHAELRQHGDALALVDLDSRNGSFVNRAPAGSKPVQVGDGDVLHFARLEMRLERQPDLAVDEATMSTTIEAVGLPRAFFGNARTFRRMLADRDVTVFYQPIVALTDRQPVAWEALARVSVSGLPTMPDDLFRVARDLDKEVELSTLLREEAVIGAARLPAERPTLFLNTRPSETQGGQVLPSLQRLVEQHPGVEIVLELHETAVTDVQRMRVFAQQLRLMGVALAYDDFGAGQARLLELADAPPRYLKFDRSVCAGLHTASGKRRKLVSTLLDIVHEFDVIAVAEGIEEEGEAAACRDIGFDLAQGYLFGRPAPAP